MQQISQTCPNCGEDNKCRHRNFSAEVWGVLLHWGEIHEPVMQEAICYDCYRELRDLLIERSVEVERMISSGSFTQPAPMVNGAVAGDVKPGQSPRSEKSARIAS
tara:strand:- start:3854 stop:4168 length:315 start_codon:yes stop_codon:yes gene_type:complete